MSRIISTLYCFITLSFIILVTAQRRDGLDDEDLWYGSGLNRRSSSSNSRDSRRLIYMVPRPSSTTATTTRTTLTTTTTPTLTRGRALFVNELALFITRKQLWHPDCAQLSVGAGEDCGARQVLGEVRRLVRAEVFRRFFVALRSALKRRRRQVRRWRPRRQAPPPAVSVTLVDSRPINGDSVQLVVVLRHASRDPTAFQRFRRRILLRTRGGRLGAMPVGVAVTADRSRIPVPCSERPAVKCGCRPSQDPRTCRCQRGRYCDGVVDCSDGSDEGAECPCRGSLRMVPAEIVVGEGGTARVSCVLPATPQCRRKAPVWDWTPNIPTSRVRVRGTTWTLFEARPSDSGRVFCRLNGLPVLPATAALSVLSRPTSPPKVVTTTTRAPPPTTTTTVPTTTPMTTAMTTTTTAAPNPTTSLLPTSPEEGSTPDALLPDFVLPTLSTERQAFVHIRAFLGNTWTPDLQKPRSLAWRRLQTEVNEAATIMTRDLGGRTDISWVDMRPVRGNVTFAVQLVHSNRDPEKLNRFNDRVWRMALARRWSGLNNVLRIETRHLSAPQTTLCNVHDHVVCRNACQPGRYCDGRRQCPQGTDEGSNCPCVDSPRPLFREVRARAGGNAILECLLPRWPACQALLRWSHPGGSLPAGRWSLLPGAAGRLALRKVGVEDAGTYTCSLGAGQSAEVRLKVLGAESGGRKPPVISINSERFISVKNGSRLKMLCESSYGDPQWEKEGEDGLPKGVTSTQNTRLALLHIPAASGPLGGQYNCFVTWGKEKELQSVFISVKCPEQRCKSSGLCILEKQLCDKKKDCPDGEDEQHCDVKLSIDSAAKLTVVEGTEFSVTCRATAGQPEWVFAEPGRRGLPEGAEQLPERGSSVLKMRTARSWMSGTYNCRLNSGNRIMVKTLKVAIECPERRCASNGQCLSEFKWCDGKQDCFYGEDENFCDSQDSSVTVQVGRRAVLRCDTSQIRFNFDTTWERADGTFLSRGNVYVIDSVSLNDRGTYVCRIRNVDDNAQVATSRLELNVVPENGPAPGGSASISSVPKANERLVIGGLIFRSCKVTDPTGGTWSYSWVYPDGRTTRSSLLYITNITPVHFGTYRCVATSSNGRRMETRFTVSPTSNGRFPSPAQGNRLSVNIVQAALGNPTILECVVEGGSGGYTYEWQKDGRILQRGQRVTIDRLDASYGGTYECVVNGIGAGGQVRGVAKYNLRLRVKQTETKISLAPAPGPTHIVEAGSNKELHCELDQAQDRQEVARWYVSRDGSKRGMVALVPPTHKIYPTRSVSILVMSDMKVSDTGRYLCIVMRNGKEVRRDATVVVVKDVGLEVYPSTMVYILGQTRSDPEYHCQVDNLPGGAKAVKWSFVPGNQPNAPEQPLPSNAKLSMRPGIFSTSFLSIRNPTMSNYGYYICRAPGGFSGRAALVVRGGGGIGRNVVRLLVKPGTTVTVDAGQTARVLCFEPSGQLGIVPNWRVPPNLQGQVTTEEQSQRRILRFRDVRPDQDGTQFVCYYRDAPPVTVTIRVNAGCPFGQRRCRSGTCIQDSLFCNGRRDCPDGSDEDRANCAKCEPNEQECQRHNNRNPIKKCVPVHWVCDGEDDCGNNWDESQNCQTGVGCDKTLFQCDDGRRIPRGFLCDGENDCRRNDDENGCSVPRIVRPSGGRPIIKRANRGSEVRLVCEAVGKGTPKIVWRYNWGFVTARNNIQERCIDPDTDISTLILSSVDIRDAGIYTCEALNNQGRAFGEDYVVEVNGR